MKGKKFKKKKYFKSNDLFLSYLTKKQQQNFNKKDIGNKRM